MKRLLALGLLVAATAWAQDRDAPDPVQRTDDGGRVVGGIRAPAGSAKWQAEIFWVKDYTPEQIDRDQQLAERGGDAHFYYEMAPWERVHSCGGALIAPDWVLTAAHCVKDDPKYPYLEWKRVRIGTQNVERGGATYRIERAVIHAGYVGDKHINDIALLHIVADAQTVPLDPARVAAIPMLGADPADQPLAPGNEVSVTGWGLTKVQNAGIRGRANARASDGTLNTGNPELQVLTPLKVFDKARCDAVPAYRGLVWPTVLCVGSEEAGKDACTGDSGGPLTRRRVLVGVVSWGSGCGLKGTPGIYTDVRQFLPWIAHARQQAPAGKVSRID